MRRVTSTELLDQDQGTPREIARQLEDLWRINRWFGGVSGSLRLLERFFSRTGTHSARILDVGAGDSRLASHLKSELQRRRLSADFCVLDRRLTHLENGRTSTRGLPAVVADALIPPFTDGSFDVVMCNLFFHHFSGERALELLRRMAKVAAEAVLVNDLERHLLPYLFVRYAPGVARGSMSRHDAQASVRQAYTRAELACIAGAAGFSSFKVEKLPFFRLGLTLWKNPRFAKG